MNLGTAMRADLYAALPAVAAAGSRLAEALAEPPAWLAEPGHVWPLTAAVGRLPADAAAVRWLPALARVPAEPLATRRARYARLFEGRNAAPRFWLYESAALTGRILGPQTAAVAALYRAAGVTPALGAELPDHAALELAFLAYLAEQAAADPAQATAWRAIEQQFIAAHGAWLIALGRGLVADGDAVYAPIGGLLADWLADLTPGPSPTRRGGKMWPVVARAEGCNLCGFCVQVCPARALRVDEDAHETRLTLDLAACIGCGKCARTCEPRVLVMTPFTAPAPGGNSGLDVGFPPGLGAVVLRRSSRAACPACGAPTVSQAELAYIAAQLGDHPAWLDYCLACRLEHIGG